MEQRKIIKGIVLITELGISIMVPIALSGAVGYFLTEKFNTGFWFILFVLLGIMAGFRNTYILIQKFYGLESENRNLEKDEKSERRKTDDDKKE